MDTDKRIKQQKNIKKATRLWDELTDIPVRIDKDGETVTDQNWRNFKKDTPIEDIWHWFEKQFNISVAEDLMYIK